MTPGLALYGATAVTADGASARDLAIRSGRIAEPAPGDRRIDLASRFLFPALVNAHDHLALNHLPSPRLPIQPSGYAWIEAFQPSFSDAAFARSLAVPEALRLRAGALKNALSGALTVAHHDPWDPTFLAPGFPVEVVSPYGWAHSLGLAGRYGPPVVDARRATPPGAPFFIHLAEGTDDVAAAELGLFEELGALDETAVLVHGVGLTHRDVTRVLSAGAAVVWCPRSNLAILGRTPAPDRLFEGGRLALGTDSRLSGAFDILEELRTASAASDLTPRELLRLVTADAARILRLTPRGHLAPGEPADLLVLSDEGGDPWKTLLAASRSDLAAVIRDGRPLIADPALWDALSPDEAGVPLTLDGVAKKAAPTLVTPREAAQLEPGLDLLG